MFTVFEIQYIFFNQKQCSYTLCISKIIFFGKNIPQRLSQKNQQHFKKQIWIFDSVLIRIIITKQNFYTHFFTITLRISKKCFNTWYFQKKKIFRKNSTL